MYYKKPLSRSLIQSLRLCGKLNVDQLLVLAISVREAKDVPELTRDEFATAIAAMLEYRCPTPRRLN